MFFESPHRVGDALRDLAEAFGADRPAALCRELTKLYEEVARGTLAELAERFADGARGEIVLVVGGAGPRRASLEDGVARVRGAGRRGVAAEGGVGRGGRAHRPVAAGAVRGGAAREVRRSSDRGSARGIAHGPSVRVRCGLLHDDVHTKGH